MKTKYNKGFSLVEVVVAVGIFAIAVVSVLGLLVPITRSISDVKDVDDASRVISVLQAEIQRLDFATIDSQILKTSSTINDFDSQSATIKKYTLLANRDGTLVGLYDADRADGKKLWNPDNKYTTQEEEDGQKFFEMVLIRNETLSPTSATDPGFLAFTLRVRWPAFTGDGKLNKQHNQKGVLLVPMAVTR